MIPVLLETVDNYLIFKDRTSVQPYHGSVEKDFHEEFSPAPG
jgi:hypothetical protein